ncbi:hypothetical protein E1264_33305 [Actinomadura sp. KC216]|uniref:hypothetical protein n=1 Tax=Actinomadura sp. KC216 TaxID=2530370 RepID=UPI00105297ED|nr:hypothetical protein [Actinomadura sp. KC216]TDB80983.1 hypothetical protein E1264_33305 [Actinomadura sp. KC216]
MELLAGLLRGLIALVGHVVAAIDWSALGRGRRRRRRLDRLERGEPVAVPGVLKDPELTGGRRQVGRLCLGDGPVMWQDKDKAVVFAPGPLALVTADESEIAFRSEDGRTELRLHPDEAPYVLKALR